MIKTGIKSIEKKAYSDNHIAMGKFAKQLTNQVILVGIPAENTGRKEGGVTNAQLIMWHTNGVRSADMIEEMGNTSTQKKYNLAHALYLQAHGSPAFKIPPRPIIEPALEEESNKQKIAKSLGSVIKLSLDNKPGEAQAMIQRTGQRAVNMIKAWFTDSRNNWPPLAESTLKAKGGKTNPLINTGELRKAMTYVIRSK